MFTQDTIEIMQKIGLKENETRVYFVCLEFDRGLQVQEIADQTKIKRSTVNLILDRLLEKNCITFHLEGSRKVFTAEAPERILNSFEENLADFRGIIPLLRKKAEQSKSAKIRFFESQEGVENIYADTLLTLKMSHETNKELLAISSGKDVFRVMPNHQRRFIDKRVQEGIPIRWIAPENEEDRSFEEGSPEALREMRFFDPKKYPFEIEIDVYANKVALTNLDESEPRGFIIEDKGLSKSFRSLFNLLWDSLKK